MKNLNLNSFLKLGYFLDYHNNYIDFNFHSINKKKYEKFNECDLINIGKEKLLKSINNSFVTHKKHVVPLSGGLDSRTVLAGLLEFTETENISTYTYGTPKTLDYEIGNYVAKKLGINHRSFPLGQYKYSTDKMIDISDRIDNQTILFHHGPIHIMDEIYKDCMIWSGFLGDALAGDHMSKSRLSDLDEAKKYFIKNNTYISSMDLMNCNSNKLFSLLDFYNNKNINLEEQLDLQNRQIKFIAPHVLIKGFNYKTPFIDKEWSNFILSIDSKYRINEYLYKKIILSTFPKAFSYKTKTNFGLPLNSCSIYAVLNRIKNKLIRYLGFNKNVNYMDFDYCIRERCDLNEVIHENIMDLQKRKIVEWIDINKIWKNHINKTGNYGDALIVLASLEIHLKAKELKRGVL